MRPRWLGTEPHACNASIIFEDGLFGLTLVVEARFCPAATFRYGLGLLELSHRGLLSAVEAEMSGQQWDYVLSLLICKVSHWPTAKLDFFNLFGR